MSVKVSAELVTNRHGGLQMSVRAPQEHYDSDFPVTFVLDDAGTDGKTGTYQEVDVSIAVLERFVRAARESVRVVK